MSREDQRPVSVSWFFFFAFLKAKKILCRSKGSFSGRGGGTRTPNTRFWRPVLYQLNYAPNRVAERTGLEPATPCVTGRYSNQLNYRSTDSFTVLSNRLRAVCSCCFPCQGKRNEFNAWQFPTLAWGDPTLPSALRRFTSEFGMGSGGTTALKPPGKFFVLCPVSFVLMLRWPPSRCSVTYFSMLLHIGRLPPCLSAKSFGLQSAGHNCIR